MAVRLARKLPQTLVLPTEVSMRRVYVGVESHDAKAVLAQFRKTPCVTVQVKVTTSPGHAVVLPSCSTLDTNVTSAAARKVVCMCVYRLELGGGTLIGPSIGYLYTLHCLLLMIQHMLSQK